MNIPLEAEKLRDHFGLNGNNLFQVCGKVKSILEKQFRVRGQTKSVTVKDCYTWMVTSGDIV